MPRSELVQTRAVDLTPGQRVRMPRARRLEVVVSVDADAYGTLVVHTEAGAYPVDRYDFVDAEDAGECWI